MTTDTNPLPPLPEPYHVVPGLAHFCKDEPLYSADQMREYARAALAAPRDAAQSLDVLRTFAQEVALGAYQEHELRAAALKALERSRDAAQPLKAGEVDAAGALRTRAVAEAPEWPQWVTVPGTLPAPMRVVSVCDSHGNAIAQLRQQRVAEALGSDEQDAMRAALRGDPA